MDHAERMRYWARMAEDEFRDDLLAAADRLEELERELAKYQELERAVRVAPVHHGLGVDMALQALVEDAAS